MLKEFKEFALKGNVVDMAVGVIIGGAFGKIVTSLVNDVVMPPFGLLLGKMPFSQLGVTLLEKTATAEAVRIKYGAFLNTIVDFLLVSFVIFLVIRQMNRITRRGVAPPPPLTKECPLCLSAIPLKARRCAHCTADLP